jgi:hypothetical protein
MPTNLGLLSSDKPLPNGKVQMRRGVADGSATVANANSGQKIIDNGGGVMEIYYTPTYPCYWVVHSNIMAHGYPDGTGWRRWDHLIAISPADADGVTTGFECPHQLYDNTSVEWRTVGASAMFRLNAGVAYTAYLATSYTSAGSVRYHTGPIWLRMVGRIVGEGVL